jgi:long-chain fatty acid transport protein
VHFTLRLFFVNFLAFSISSAASLIGADSLGMSQHPQNAAVVRDGLAPQNPALNAFENKTKFGTTIQYEYASASKGKNSIAVNSFTVPSISMVLPLGPLGTFGIGLEQKYFANERLELIDPDPAIDANVLYIARAGLYELAPSYSIRLPYALSDFALGASYRIIFGNSYSYIERGMSQNWGEDSWKAKNVFITEKETAIFEPKDKWYKPFGGGIHFHKKSLDYFFSYFPSLKAEKIIKANVQFGVTDTLQSASRTEKFELPERFATGMHFIFLQKQNISFVYEHEKYEEPASSYFVEYKISGTGLFYSSFFQRNNFGLKAWYAEKYIKDVEEYGGSLFSDIWIGRRGTLVGLALLGGYRNGGAKYWNEPFLGFNLNLTGVGNWGTSSRRR